MMSGALTVGLVANTQTAGTGCENRLADLGEARLRELTGDVRSCLRSGLPVGVTVAMITPAPLTQERLTEERSVRTCIYTEKLHWVRQSGRLEKLVASAPSPTQERRWSPTPASSRADRLLVGRIALPIGRLVESEVIG